MPALRDVPTSHSATPASILTRQARRRLGLDPGGFVVLHCGRMAPRGGVDTIILGVALLRRRHGVRATLLVVSDPSGAQHDPGNGAGLERARLRQLARELGIEHRVHFIVPEHDGALRDCRAAADVLVSMPWGERPGDAGREAAAWTRSIIAAAGNCAGVGDGSNTCLVAPRDAEALAHQLARLQRCPDGRPERRPDHTGAMDAAGQARVPA